MKVTSRTIELWSAAGIVGGNPPHNQANRISGLPTGEDRAERIHIISAQIRVLVTVRPKYACAKCSSGVIQAPAPAHLIEGALPPEGALAHVAIAKYADHCPLYRQSQILSRSGLDLHRSTFANWMGKVSFHIAPVVDRLAEHLKSSAKLFMPSRQHASHAPAG